MEKYLPYITTIITVLAAVSGGVFSVVKYVDMRNREDERLKYENFRTLIEKITISFRNTEQHISTPEMISLIYQLKSFKEQEYIEAILVILNFYKNDLINHDLPDFHKKYIKDAIEDVLNELNMSKLERFFASLRMTKKVQNDR